MAKEKCVWTGASGSRYTYYVHPIGWRAAPDQDGNYIYARLDRTNKDGVRWWKPVYIGQGDLADRSDVGSHHKSGCIKRSMATHFHCHSNEHHDKRLSEEADLLEKWDTPCNG